MAKIKGVFFDLGGTLRIAEEVPEHQERAKARMAQLAGAILEKQDGRELLRRAKTLLMEKRRLTEQEAYTLLAGEAKARGMQLSELARSVIAKGGKL